MLQSTSSRPSLATTTLAAQQNCKSVSGDEATRRESVALDDVQTVGPSQPTLLSNATCVYCAASFGEQASTKEHVLARHFVPTGSLQASWNLIVRACAVCNSHKADLEDDLSALTVQPDAFGHHATQDPLLISDSRRKALRSISRRTKKPVQDSSEQLRVGGTLGPKASIEFRLEAPPQPDPTRAFELACLQVRALIYWVSFNPETRRGGFWEGGFFPLNAAMRRDWGNSDQRAFAAAVVGWEPQVLIRSVASGYFRAAVRRHPEAECWSWALEWNQSYRLTGFFGDGRPVHELFATFPPLEMKVLQKSAKKITRYREEVPLTEAEDTMFSYAPWESILDDGSVPMPAP